MADTSDFKRCQIVDACMVGASVTKTAQMFGISRGTVSKVMIAFEKKRKENVWLKAKVVRARPSNFTSNC